MTNDRWQQLQDLYERITSLPPQAREPAIIDACAGDAVLERELRRLVRLSESRADFMADPALGTGFSLAADETPDDTDLIGEILGGYRIERLIGRGGMGKVYLAVREDEMQSGAEPRVAIKVVRLAATGLDVRRRFADERRTLERLDHPNIRRLLDGGVTSDGRPFLVLEYLDGERIDDFCRQRQLGLRQRLKLFMMVCSAVHYAHQNLVIHRDIKPGNILVTVDGTPKLLDFGIARLMGEGAEARAVTAADERRLTPEYASPEQVDGKPVTTATDVYSLGVVLFELLAGRGPYELATRSTEEIRRAVSTQSPPAPSMVVLHAVSGGDADPKSREAAHHLRSELRGDLDTIVLKALRKEPERRYASAEDFARDIDRFLRGLPVSARKDTLVYRTGKFLRRNALFSATAAVAGAGLVALSIVAHLNARDAAYERDAAIAAREEADEVVEFFRDMLASADPDRRGPDATVGALLADAATRAEGELAGRPLVKATIQSAIGTAYLGLSRFEEAGRLLQAAHDARLEHLGELHADVAESRAQLGTLNYHLRRFEEAERLVVAALAAYGTLRGEESTDVARMLNALGGILHAQGKLEEAESAFDRALAIRLRVFGENDLSVAQLLNNIANLQRTRGDLAGAQATIERALAIRRARLPDNHPLLAQAIANLAVLIQSRAGEGDGDGEGESLARAEGLYREALAIQDATLPREHTARGATLTGLGVLLRTRGEVEAEVAVLQELLEVWRATIPLDDVRAVRTSLRLSDALSSLGRLTEASAVLERTAAEVGPEHPAASAVQEALEDLARAASIAPG